ncbi:hypothetical protein MTBBW1_1630038 [Desulfamplus magnetovallimortis]|uniref:Uncharacterized protein n=1 Tax=Desulfamplus magnetovallimortis TaxID=1246637 RepID=A0A1W1H992_9BACT|nr:hypothetical protein MTBBW1_1630038 [Desulfamplus magnetovallimortis]
MFHLPLYTFRDTFPSVGILPKKSVNYFGDDMKDASSFEELQMNHADLGCIHPQKWAS